MHPYVNLMWKYTVTKTKLKAIHKLYTDDIEGGTYMHCRYQENQLQCTELRLYLV